MEDLRDEFVVNILSRLPVKKIIHCKCVCKKWLDLISDPYFENLRLSRSPPILLIHHDSVGYDRRNCQPGILTWVEVEDDLDHHHLHRDPLMNLNLNLSPIFQESNTLFLGSVDGMVYLQKERKDSSYICNPITRECMILPLPKKQHFRHDTAIITSCFGVGSITKKYKVIRICQQLGPVKLLEAEVYTIGTGGQWRSLSLGNVPSWLGGDWLGGGCHAPFLNGHAHWSMNVKDCPEKIFVFDFDNETFKLFPSPIEDTEDGDINHKSLAVLKGCLWQSNTSGGNSEFTFWVMKEYGIKESWCKELVIGHRIARNLSGLIIQPINPIEHLRDGTILMVRYGEKLSGYSCEGRTIADTDYGFDHCFSAMAYRPSFLKLRNFESEIVYVL